MSAPVTPKTAGETLFESYLTKNNIGWDPAPSRGSKPDYLLRLVPDDVICEVEDFGEGGIDRDIRAVLEARMDENERAGRPRVGWAVGSWDSTPRIQQNIKHAAEQLRPFKAEFPCVIVLYNPGAFVDLGDPLLLRALFGSAPGAGGLSALWQRKKNTTVSAVAVMDQFRPNEHIVDRALAEQNAGDIRRGLSQSERVARGLEIIGALNAKYGREFLDEARPRLRVIHNPFAARPLSPATFTGPRDEHVLFDAQTGDMVQAWSARGP